MCACNTGRAKEVNEWFKQKKLTTNATMPETLSIMATVLTKVVFLCILGNPSSEKISRGRRPIGKSYFGDADRRRS